MSMKQAKGRQTKGKQKIEMKKVEAYTDRMITFSKRKSTINKKMNEIISLCGVEAAILVFSEAGKPYSFANPSMEEMAGRLKNHSESALSAKDNNNIARPLIEAYNKQKMKNIMKKYMELLEELKMENEKMKLWKKTRNEKEMNKMWWNFNPEDLSVEQLEKRDQCFVMLYNKLRDLTLTRDEKDDNDSTSGSAGGHGGDGQE